MRVSASCGPIAHTRFDALIKRLKVPLEYWSEPDRVRLGKYAALATPICALDAAILRSASATSGRLSRSVEGTPAGTVGTSLRMVDGLNENSAGCLPTKTATA